MRNKDKLLRMNGGKQRTTPRIVLHTPEPISSPAIYLDELSRALTIEGVFLHLVCPSNYQARGFAERNPMIQLCATGERSTNPTHGLARKVWDNLRFLFSSGSVLFSTTRRGDIVHFQYNLHFPFGALFFLLARFRGARIVFTVHDPLPHKWTLPRWLRFIERGALSWVYRTSDVLIVHSEAGRRRLLEAFHENPVKIRVIVHGPYELGKGILPMPKSDCLEVLLFGALRENKGARFAIEAVQRLHSDGVQVRLTIAGSVLNRKEQAYWTRCKEQIEVCPQPIRLLEGFVPDEELSELFSRCHCLLLPYTQFSSDSGVAFMALANGRAIISTRCGGLGALIDSSGGGIAISEPTTDAVADALRFAVNAGVETIEGLGRTGTNWVLDECGWQKVARQTRLVYEQLLGKSFLEAAPRHESAFFTT